MHTHNASTFEIWKPSPVGGSENFVVNMYNLSRSHWWRLYNTFSLSVWAWFLECLPPALATPQHDAWSRSWQTAFPSVCVCVCLHLAGQLGKRNISQPDTYGPNVGHEVFKSGALDLPAAILVKRPESHPDHVLVVHRQHFVWHHVAELWKFYLSRTIGVKLKN